MDDILRLGFGGISLWLPVVTVLAVFGVGFVYFLAPVLGYIPTRRGLLLISLWLLVIRMGMGIIMFALLLDEDVATGVGMMGKGAMGGRVVWVLLALLDYGLFVLAMALFVGGLASLRRKEDFFRPPGIPQLRDRDE
jgi:hypothetical protein